MKERARIGVQVGRLRYHHAQMIPLTIPALGDEEIAAATRVLRSGMLVQGREVEAFEAELCRRTGRKHAIAVASGTTALELSLRALGVGPRDTVLCPALTWPSPAHAALTVGAEVALVDVDPAEWNATPATFAEADPRRARAAIVIDQFGSPARHRELAAQLAGTAIVVDAACSLGADLAERPAASYGVIACTSFHPRKVLTTGEGGACLTDDDALAEKLRVLRNHGQRAPGDFACASGNHRLTELAAAIGRVQLDRLDALVAARRSHATALRAALPGLTFQSPAPGARPNEQTLGVLIGEPGSGAAERDRVVAGLRERGVQAGLLSYALDTLPQLADAARAAEREGRTLRHARDIAARGLALPLFPSMTEAQRAEVVRALREVLTR